MHTERAIPSKGKTKKRRMEKYDHALHKAEHNACKNALINKKKLVLFNTSLHAPGSPETTHHVHSRSDRRGDCINSVNEERSEDSIDSCRKPSPCPGLSIFKVSHCRCRFRARKLAVDNSRFRLQTGVRRSDASLMRSRRASSGLIGKRISRIVLRYSR